MPELAIVAWFVYFSLAFGYRSYVQLRTTGRTGFVGFGGARALSERTAGALFVMALLLGLIAPLVALFSPEHALGTLLDTSPGLTIAGGLLFALGLSTTLLAQWAMGRAWRIGVDASERTDLVVAGPFTLVRNPIFSAMLITAAGLVGLCPSWLALGAFAALGLALELQVRWVEEPYLRCVHGKAYAEYARTTGRFVPGFGLLRG